ncbi:P-loop NTPase [Halorubrum sp. SY-15]|uniref:nucleotide-binding protein n=1 Tax=Halorubrum sp. SY-15 TaxID=3402277 RepID=UPI003EBD4B1D
MPTVYAVASAKGGVGKTTTAAGLATALAAAGESVVAVDGDVGSPALAATLGVEPGATTIHDVLAGRAAPTTAVVDGPAGLRVVPGDPSLEAFAAADPTGLESVLTAFEDASSVVVDTSAGLTHATARVLALADETLLVTTPDPRSVTATETTRVLTTRLGGHVTGVVLVRASNEMKRVDDAAEAEQVDDAAEAEQVDGLETPVLERIPEDPAVGAAVAAGESLLTFDPSATANRAYQRLAATLTGREVDTTDARGDAVAAESPGSQPLSARPSADPTPSTAETEPVGAVTGANPTASATDGAASVDTTDPAAASADSDGRERSVDDRSSDPRDGGSDEVPFDASDAPMDDAGGAPTDGNPGAGPDDDGSGPMSTALTGSTDARAPPDDESGGQGDDDSGRGGLLSRLFGR